MKLVKKNNKIDEKTLDQLPVPVIVFNTENVLFINSKFKRVLQLSKINKSQFEKQLLAQFFKKPSISVNQKKKSSKNIEENETDDFILNLRIPGKKVVLFQLLYNRLIFKSTGAFQCTLNKKLEQDEKRQENLNSELLLDKVSTNSRDLIFYITVEKGMQLRFISAASKKILGHYPEEVYNKPNILFSIIKPFCEPLLEASKPGLKGKRTEEQKFLTHLRRANGENKHFEITLISESSKITNTTGLVGIIHDVTERILTEELLIETKNKFDLITNNANDIIAFDTYYPKGKYLYVSPNIKRILGYNPEDLLNDNSFLSKKLSGKNEEFVKFEQMIREHQKRNSIKNLHYSFKILNSKKEEVWLENSLVPITNDKGKISFFINILRDITEQKESELEVENQNNNYRNLLDNSPVAYMIHDHGVCVFLNNAMGTLLRLKSKNQMLGKFVLDLFDGSERKKAAERIHSIYENKRSKNKYNNYSIKDAEGIALEVEIKSVPLKYNNKDCILSLVNNLNDRRQREKEKIKTLITETANKQLQKEIKERQEAEKSLTEKTAHLSSILENSTHLIWTVNEKYEITSYNQNFHNVVMLQHKVSIKPGDKIDELLLSGREDYVNLWYTKYREAFAGKKLEFVKEDFYNGSVFRKIFINPIYNERREVKEISCIANDITDSKIYEQKLLNQTGKLSAIFDSSHHYIWTIDGDGKLTSFNKNYYDLVTALYNTKPFLGLVLNRGVLANDKEYSELLQFHYDKAFVGLATSFEIETRDKDNMKVYLEIFLNPIFENDKVVEVSGIAHNVTEKKYVQQRMEQSLKEKEVLLREVHHRVKNNMQVISSILNLQSSYVSDDYALTLLKETQNRIKTMAYIHESLYQNKSFTSVNFSEYVHTLVKNIVQSYSYSSDKIGLELNIQDLTLSLDSSIPAGLIINELITNAIKHAFPGAKKGIISFSLRSENNFVILELKDDGVGFAPGLDFENSHTLGLQLVNTLIEQIEGELKYTSEKDKGTEVTVKFKM
ncbi:MAG: PAS domain S-box protein [bacterium]|nr:PAS domain S-box protein [bacterium]